MKRVTLSVLLAGLFVYFIGAQGITRTERTVGYSIRDTADYNGNRYISYWGQHPHVLTFVNGCRVIVTTGV